MPIQDPLTEAIIGAAFRVSNILGAGFLEKIYENALVHELSKQGLTVLQQHGIQVRYDGVVVGAFFADLLVEGRIVVELKAAKALDDTHAAQCINYLKATGLDLCLLINFGKPRIEFKRIVLGLAEPATPA
ncbi:GxxExxY protein [Holophaga foetida]|uniref:GxxExxY protein n=1 Tax=Holophaga foetida TaxID=35839 RepID=UPI0002473F39|nr:GxxExxY protein [Holophaga foetida]